VRIFNSRNELNPVVLSLTAWLTVSQQRIIVWTTAARTALNPTPYFECTCIAFIAHTNATIVDIDVLIIFLVPSQALSI
jgi:hypothetical protein